jgi:hypothetical protein
VIRLFATMDGIDPALLKALEQGTYVIDPRAVADAILRRHEDIVDARRLSRVLVAAEFDEPPIRRSQGDSSAGADVA